MESKTYKDLWFSLNQVNSSLIDEEFIPGNLDVSIPDIEEYFSANSSHKFMHLGSIKPKDNSYLKERGISNIYLNKNINYSIYRNRLSRDHRGYQTYAVKNKFILAVCPFTGEIIKSNQSIVVTREVIFYRFQSREVFYIATTQLGQGFIKGALYFPADDLVVKADDVVWGLQEKHIVQLKALIVGHYKDFYNYFSDSNSHRKIALIFGDQSFAHHIWNELSGLYKLHEKGCLNEVGRFFVAREPLGSVNEIFPEISGNKIKYINSGRTLDRLHTISTATLEEIICKNYFALNVGECFIKDSLVERVYNVATQNTSFEFRSLVEEASNKFFPLIFITIKAENVKTGNRTLINQVDRLSKVIDLLAQKFPQLGVIFDGYSLAADYVKDSAFKARLILTDFELALIKDEIEIANQIIANLSHLNIGMFNTVGCSLWESNLWAHAADLYLSHHGTIQHKIGWLANKPGVVHANRKVAQENPLWVVSVREFGIPPIYISHLHIRDVETRKGEQDLRDNVDDYDIDWKVLYNEVWKLVKSIEKKSTLTGREFPMFINILKRLSYFLKESLKKLIY